MLEYTFAIGYRKHGRLQNSNIPFIRGCIKFLINGYDGDNGDQVICVKKNE